MEDILANTCTMTSRYTYNYTALGSNTLGCKRLQNNEIHWRWQKKKKKEFAIIMMTRDQPPLQAGHAYSHSGPNPRGSGAALEGG